MPVRKGPRKKAAAERTVDPIAQHMRRVMDRASRSPLTRLLALRLKNAGHRLESRVRGGLNFQRAETADLLRHEAIDRLVALDASRGQATGSVADKVCDCLLLLVIAEGRHTRSRVKKVSGKPNEAPPETGNLKPHTEVIASGAVVN